jgi:hypothetical protein
MHLMAEGLYLMAQDGLQQVRETISRAQVNLHGVTDPAGHLLGSALFGRASMFNHSCRPSCAVSFFKARLQVRTSRRVTKGEELSIG